MRRLLISFALLFSVMALSAQSNDLHVISNGEDVFEAQPEAVIDSSFFGIDIFALVSHSSQGEGVVKINQSNDVSNGMQKYISNNKAKKISGWRVRIYFDNDQNARTQSEAIARSFAAAYPRVRVYRSHVSPYFKVTVGDFRTKFEAQQFSNQIKSAYPSVFLVKETINYPSL